MRKRTFPYAFARISAMKSKLVQKNEYHKMLKMDLSSITRFLQESEYKNSITRLSSKYSGLELVDRSLRRNQARTYTKLRRICPEDVVAVIDLYLTRSDYQNLKVVLRGLVANAETDEVSALLEPTGKFNRTYYENLFKTGDVYKALIESKLVSAKEIKLAYEKFKEKNQLIELENKLDKLYYEKSIQGARSLGEYSKAFRDFLLRDIDVVNMINLIRFKNEGLNASEIEDYFIYEGLRLNRKMLKKLAKKDGLAATLQTLKETYYGRHVKFEGSIGNIELKLNGYHMKSAFVVGHESPLSIQTILNYMTRKMIEIRNLRSLVKSKHLGIDADIVEKKLLVI